MSFLHKTSSLSSASNDDMESLLRRDGSFIKPQNLMRPLRRRTIFYVLGAVFLLLTFSSFMYKTRIHGEIPVVVESTPKVEKFDRLSVVRGPPTEKFRDNLKPDLKYITSWLDAGWTNDVITYMNLIYLALITERIPLIGVFSPTHVSFDTTTTVDPIDFGTIFDVPRLSKLINLPVIEWHEVKNRNSTEVEELGCWDVWSTSEMATENPRGSRTAWTQRLDLSYTKTPAWAKLIPNFQHDRHASLFALASLAYPETRLETLREPITHESPLNHVRLPPDEHLLCYDYLYYISGHFAYEFEYDYSPEWRFVGQHMHWAPELERIADQYVRRAMGIEDSEESTPLYISIHVRHRDFEAYCNNQPLNECFASLDVIGRRVDEVRQELLFRKGIDVQRVVLTSDERNATWWDDVKQRGWYTPDHSETTNIYGYWYPPLIDAVIQSNGAGFVGNDMSTMTSMARRRVQSWHDGPVRAVKWGKPDADDH